MIVAIAKVMVLAIILTITVLIVAVTIVAVIGNTDRIKIVTVEAIATVMVLARK